MNLLNIFLYGTAIIAWSILIGVLIGELIEWFRKLNQYGDRISNQYNSIVRLENDIKDRIGSLKQNNADQIKALNDRLEKLEGKKRK